MFSMGVTSFEVGSRQQPFHGVGFAAIMDKLNARFKVSQKMLKRDISEVEQLEEWLEDNPLDERRPDLSQIEDGCPPQFLELIRSCWADTRAARPTFCGLGDELLRLAHAGGGAARQRAEGELEVVRQQLLQAQATVLSKDREIAQLNEREATSERQRQAQILRRGDRIMHIQSELE